MESHLHKPVDKPELTDLDIRGNRQKGHRQLHGQTITVYPGYP